MHAVYIARINRRVRLVGDGLVATMAHLWSKFTKCLRPSKGALAIPVLCHPRMLSLRAHNAASFAIITSLLSPPRGSNGDPSSFHLSFALRLVCLPLFSLYYVHICISSLCNLPSNLKLFRLCNEYNIDNKIFLAQIINLPTI